MLIIPVLGMGKINETGNTYKTSKICKTRRTSRKDKVPICFEFVSKLFDFADYSCFEYG